MELGEKLQQLRKSRNLTQEKLAEQLFVSRTAISKWESCKGYPSIESLKAISKLFSVSIDELLSGEELIIIAESESQTNLDNLLGLIYGLLDVMALTFIFFPIYGEPAVGGGIRFVSLLAYQNITPTTKILYYISLILLILVGIYELIGQLRSMEKGMRYEKLISLSVHTIVILFFILTRQPYVTFFLFLFLAIKIVLLSRSSKQTEKLGNN